MSVSHTEELLQLLLPILKSEVATTYPPKVYRKELFNHNFATFQVNGIDFYINGHDHCLGHISSRDRLASIYTKVNFYSNLEFNMHANINKSSEVVLPI